MASSIVHAEIPAERAAVTPIGRVVFAALREQSVDTAVLTLAIWCVPLSIAVAEFFLAIALLARIVGCARGRAQILLPRVFWFWLAWAGLALLSCCLSPEPTAGKGEMRHLALVGCLFFVMPAFQKQSSVRLAWKGAFIASTLGSLFLIGDFISRCFYYRREIAAGGDVGLYLRTGGLLNHWMVFGTVEILIVAGLLSFWSFYPELRRRWWPVLALNGLAILLSLTRTVWLASLFLGAAVLAWRRSRWLWLLPAFVVTVFLLAPGAIRTRLRQSLSPDYYSNLERVQMLRVGWKMIKQHSLTGVGPGRIEKLYPAYLSAGDPVPAYHGHLHNNLVEIAAEFGVPTTLAALAFCGVLLLDLRRALLTATAREARFASLAALLGLSGFLLAGFFDYTYGHSLGLILLAFSVLPPLSLFSPPAQVAAIFPGPFPVRGPARLAATDRAGAGRSVLGDAAGLKPGAPKPK
ncbi:MAG: O-antigen ligase family protein [Acidobacteriia bacterium]|nr:O-antigen ligase family protein [Terriglobia bacterium]